MKKKLLTMASMAWLLVTVFLSVGIGEQVEAAVSGPTNITVKHACISMPDGKVTAPTGTPAACPDGTIKMWLPADNDNAGALIAPGSFVITATVGDNLTINLSNELAIPVSLTIPGQVLSNNTGPVWFTDISAPYTSPTVSGSRPANDFTSRVRSFSHETAAGTLPGAPTAYTWNNLKAGTYLILSGTHPSMQVQMGIYGLLIVTAAGGGPYTGIATPAQEITLLFSEIDPAMHDAADDAAMVETSPSIPSTNDFKPKYFLINGKAFPGNNPIPIGAPGSTTLLRFANAGLDTYVPLLQSQYIQVIAEDGYLKDANLRFNRYSVDLHAGKTFDALLTNPASAGYLPLYDRRLYLSNADQAPGGMLTYLEVGGPGPNTLTVATNGGTGTGKVAAVSMPGGIYCNSAVTGSDCTQAYNAGAQIKLAGYPDAGSLLKPDNSWVGCDSVTTANECIVTMSGPKTVTAAFQGYSAVKLINPNGGESVPSAKYYTINWGAPSNAVKFRLRYSLDGGVTWRLIGKNLTGNSYNWLVPAIRGNQKNVKVQITGYNAKGNAIGTDVSNAVLSIDVVTVTVPAKGGTCSTGVGSSCAITWVTNAPAGLVKKIDIQYSKNNGSTWELVTSIDNASGLWDAGGTYEWDIPEVTANKPNSFVRVTLRDAVNKVVAKDKSGKFTITP